MRLSEDLRLVLFDNRIGSSNLAKNLIAHNVSFTTNRIKIHKQLATQASSQTIKLFSHAMGFWLRKMKMFQCSGKYR